MYEEVISPDRGAVNVFLISCPRNYFIIIKQSLQKTATQTETGTRRGHVGI